jgi:hypothetical protein
MCFVISDLVYLYYGLAIASCQRSLHYVMALVSGDKQNTNLREKIGHFRLVIGQSYSRYMYVKTIQCCSNSFVYIVMMEAIRLSSPDLGRISACSHTFHYPQVRHMVRMLEYEE